jgi:hypothetical protein
MIFYIAGAWTDRPFLRNVRTALIDHGHQVTETSVRMRYNGVTNENGPAVLVTPRAVAPRHRRSEMRDKFIPNPTQPNCDDIPFGYCHCGCGQKTTIVKKSHAAFGLVRGQPRRFVYGHRNRWAELPVPRVVGEYAEVPIGGDKRPDLLLLIDVDDLWIVREKRWYVRRARNTNYASSSQAEQFHRVLLGLSHGDPVRVDHINGNGLDNRRSNLRLCTTQQNAGNVHRPAKGRSRFRGVYWVTKAAKWEASIRNKNHRKYIGRFATEEEAARAYDAAAKRILGEFATLNFPDEATA